MTDNVLWIALGFGLLSALPLPLGAAIGLAWRPGERVVAFMLAFGGGALLAALTLDLVAPGVDRGHFGQLAIGAVIGGLLFKVLDLAVNRRGGYLRKPSTAMTHWRGNARRKLGVVLADLQRTQHLQTLDADSLDELLGMVVVEDVPAGTVLYRKGERPNRLYIVDKGVVELLDPQLDGAVFERVGRHAVFGRLSFITGLPRATEARTAEDCTLLAISRPALMEALIRSIGLRRFIVGMVDADRVERYLCRRQGLEPEEASEWRAEAVESLLESGRYAPPIDEDDVDLSPLIVHEARLGVFASLPETSVRRIADRMAMIAVDQAATLFHAGDTAERLMWVIDGEVRLEEPRETGSAQLVHPGEAFGGLSFLTGGRHVLTAVATEPTELAVLRRTDFLELVDEDPDLRSRIGEFVKSAEVSEYLVGGQHVDPKRAAAWMSKAAQTIESRRLVPTVEELTSSVAGQHGAAMAMYLGILLDGIPESFVIGANVLSLGTLSLSLLAGLFLANLPEAMSSAVGMREQGMGIPRIMTMWTSLMVITGLGAAFGTILLADAPDVLFALIEGIAAGAMLTMIAETMLPEAFHKGGGLVGLSTLGGFLAAISCSQL